MDGFAFGTGCLSHNAHFRLNILFDIQLRQGNRQANGMAQRGNGFNFIDRRVFQHQLCQRTESHFLAVVIMMCIRDCGQTVMNGVSRCQTTAFKTDATQIGVGFNNTFQCWCHHVLLGCQHRFFTFFDQRIKAQLCQRQRRLSTLTARHGGCAAA